MSMEILIDNQQDKLMLSPELQAVITKTLEEIARQQQVAPDAEVGVVVVDNEQIREVNAEYRHLDQITDVISFALNDDADEPGVTGDAAASQQNLLGDIVVSLEQAAIQAVEYGHSLERELAFLVGHGMLHLLGFDHQDEAGEMKMQLATEAALSELGLNR